jgi:hypothetical protein
MNKNIMKLKYMSGGRSLNRPRLLPSCDNIGVPASAENNLISSLSILQIQNLDISSPTARAMLLRVDKSLDVLSKHFDFALGINGKHRKSLISKASESSKSES